MRKPIITANWKMHKTVGEALSFIDALAPRVQNLDDVEVVIAGPFTALAAMKDSLRGLPVALAAENVHPEPKGAYTGEISVAMLHDVGCTYVIVGHSERRSLFGDTNEFVADKAHAAFAGGLKPIVCVGESLAEREADQAESVVADQLKRSLARIEVTQAPDLVVAYEPVWAIGTGLTATPEIAQEMHAFIRAELKKAFADTANQIRIQYGGSVKPDNIFTLLSQADIDGVLVGGASLDPDSFYAIIQPEQSKAEARP